MSRFLRFCWHASIKAFQNQPLCATKNKSSERSKTVLFRIDKGWFHLSKGRHMGSKSSTWGRWGSQVRDQVFYLKELHLGLNTIGALHFRIVQVKNDRDGQEGWEGREGWEDKADPDWGGERGAGVRPVFLFIIFTKICFYVANHFSPNYFHYDMFLGVHPVFLFIVFTKICF